jgi:transcriptional regulator with XRE-family HTH domain
MEDKARAVQKALGRDLRGLRKSRGMTIQQLGQKIGRSVGFISQIERGLSNPALADLRAVAAVLEVPLSWFYLTRNSGDAEQEFIVRAGARRSLGSAEEGLTEELLSPDLGGSFEMFRTVIEPHARHEDPIFRETEEAAYLVSGILDLWIDKEKFSLKAGDSFRYRHKPYHWHNPGDTPAVLVWVVSPPVY